MNDEPNVKLPEPPEGMKWEYRGLGFRKLEATCCYCNEDNLSCVYGGENALGLSNLHYWEAVSTDDHQTQVDGYKCITEADALRSENAELRTQLTNHHEYRKALETIKNGYQSENVKLRNELEAAKCDIAEKKSLITHRDILLREANETITRLRANAKPTDPTEGGKYRLLEEGEMLGKEDQYFCHVEGKWEGVYKYNDHNKPLKCSYWGSDVRRPVKPTPEPDYAQQAKDLQKIMDWHSFYKGMREIKLDNFVDLILKAAKQQ